MVRRKPFAQEHIGERAGWPEIKAGLRGHASYDELGILSPKQRGELVRLARVEPEREKTFIEEVTCNIIGYRRRIRVADQESLAAVAESMRRLIDRVYAYSCDVGEYPLIVIHELKPPLPTADWFQRANEKLQSSQISQSQGFFSKLLEISQVGGARTATVPSRYQNLQGDEEMV